MNAKTIVALLMIAGQILSIILSINYFFGHKMLESFYWLAFSFYFSNELSKMIDDK